MVWLPGSRCVKHSLPGLGYGWSLHLISFWRLSCINAVVQALLLRLTLTVYIIKHSAIDYFGQTQRITEFAL